MFRQDISSGKNVLGFERKFDTSILARKRRVRAKLKDTDAMLEFTKDAQSIAIKELGLDSIAMVAATSIIFTMVRKPV